MISPDVEEARLDTCSRRWTTEFKFCVAGYWKRCWPSQIAWLTLNLPLFDNDFTRSVNIFGVDNSSSSQIDNGNNNFLVLGEWPNDDMESIGTAYKKFRVNFSKAERKFC